MHINLLASKLQALSVAVADLADATSTGSRSRDAALLSLLHRRDITVTGLAAVLGLSQPATTRLVAALEREGLVHRVAPARRERLLRLTRAGTRAAGVTQDRRLSAVARQLGCLSDEQRTALDDLVSRVLASAADSAAEGRRLCRLCDHEICSGDDCPVGSAVRSREGEKDR